MSADRHSTFFLSVVALYKDEPQSSHLIEWTSHHIRQTDHIYLLLDDTSTANGVAESTAHTALGDLVEAGCVSLLAVHAFDGSRWCQKCAYAAALPVVRSEFIAIIDTDEFLAPTDPMHTAATLLRSTLQSSCDLIVLPWLSFLSNSTDDPQRVRESMLWRLPFPDAHPPADATPGQRKFVAPHNKVLVRTSSMRGTPAVHGVATANGTRRCQSDRRQRHSLLIFHYRVRSRVDWARKRRTFANNWNPAAGWSLGVHAPSARAELDDRSLLDWSVARAACRDPFLYDLARGRVPRSPWGGFAGASHHCFGANAAAAASEQLSSSPRRTAPAPPPPPMDTAVGAEASPFTLCSAVARRRLAEDSLRTGRSDARAWAAVGGCLDRRRAGAPVWFLHVSKSGGSSLCAAAAAAGCHDAGRAEGGRNGCWSRELGDGPDWMVVPMARTRHNVSCAERLAHCRRRGIDFLAREAELPTPDGTPTVCSGSLTSVMLVNDPIVRLASHLGEIYAHSYEAVGYGKLLPPSEMLLRGGRHYDVSRLLRSPFALLADNFLTRYLSGAPASKLPFGTINASHAAAAMRTLRAVDWVLPLASSHVGRVLVAALGWPRAAAWGAEPERARVGRLNFTIDDASERWLRHVNRHDAALLAEAEHLHRLDLMGLEQLKAHSPRTLDGLGGRACSNSSHTALRSLVHMHQLWAPRASGP